MSEESVRQLLKNIGLPEKEIDVYLFLSRQGHLKCEEIASNMKKSRPQIYKILRNLESRSMLETTLQYPTLYGAISLERVLDLNIKEKKRDVFLLAQARKEILKHWGGFLKKGQINSAEKLIIIEGKNKIYPRILQMAENAKSEFLILNNGTELEKSFQADFNQVLLRLSKRKNFKVYALLSETSIGDIELAEVFRRNSGSDKGYWLYCRLLEPVLNCPMRFVVQDSKEAVFFTKFSGDPFCRYEGCVWTNSSAVVSILRLLFERLWAGADSISALEILRKNGFSGKSKKEISKWYTLGDSENLADSVIF
jgi:sugar-specific transcriptional regulator TrmB